MDVDTAVQHQSNILRFPTIAEKNLILNATPYLLKKVPVDVVRHGLVKALVVLENKKI